MKTLIKLLILAAAGFGLLLLACWFLLPRAAKAAVEEGSQHAFGLPTELVGIGASLGASTSGVKLSGYRVANPEGFGAEPLLRIDTLKFDVGTRSLLGEPKEIDELVLDGFELSIVQKGLESNLLAAMKSIRSSGSGDGGEAESEGSTGSAGPRLRVGRVQVSGLAAVIDVTGIPGVEDVHERFELPAYEEDWTERSGGSGVTVAELAGILVTRATDKALVAAEGSLPPAAVQALRLALDGELEDSVSGALDALGSEAVKSATEEIEKGLGGLLEGVKKDGN